LAKNLAILDEQTFENENARESLRQFMKSIEHQLGEAGVEGPLDQGPMAPQGQSVDVQDGAPRDGSMDVSDLQGVPVRKDGKAFGAAVSNLSHQQASQNTAAGDVSTQ
jgi:hypothetical protein